MDKKSVAHNDVNPHNTYNSDISNYGIGVVGLGLMGSSIVASLLAVGHSVVAISPLKGELNNVTSRIKNQLQICEKGGFLSKTYVECIDALTVSENYQTLKNCRLVVECVVEDIAIKEEVFRKIVEVVNPNTILASNTSAIPISVLQNFIENPERFLGIHWAEPAHATRFLEIICGNKTSAETASQILELAQVWGKEPTLLKKDIRGFITNRLLYAVYRESLSLIEAGFTNIQDADKAFRYDAGAWMTVMGIFKRMDYLGLRDCQQILNNLLPLLSNADGVPATVERLMEENARGTQNGIGFYNYTEEEGKKWNRTFEHFNEEIYRLVALYPLRVTGEVLE